MHLYGKGRPFQQTLLQNGKIYEKKWTQPYTLPKNSFETDPNVKDKTMKLAEQHIAFWS